jgi:hypothetical protein
LKNKPKKKTFAGLEGKSIEKLSARRAGTATSTTIDMPLRQTSLNFIAPLSGPVVFAPKNALDAKFTRSANVLQQLPVRFG